MGARVGALLIDMAMNTAAFASDLSKSNSALNSWASNSNRVLGGVVNGYRNLGKEMTSFVSNTFTMRNAIMTLVGSSALGLFINRQIEAASAIVDTADNIGISTKTLQEYTFAARLSSIQTDQLQGAMKNFATSVGQAHGESGRLYTFLSNTNPVLLQQVVNAKSVDEALNAVFGTMGKLTSQTDRLALASAAFGKANTNLVNLVKEGSDAFEATRARASALGIVIRDDLLRSAEDAGDKIDILSQVLKAQMIVAVAENAQGIGNLASALTNAAPKIIEFATGALNVVAILLDWKVSLLELGATLNFVASSVLVAKEKLKEYATVGLYDASEATKKIVDDLTEANMKIKAQIDDIKSNRMGSPVTPEAVATTQAATRATDGYAQAMKRQADAAKEAETEMNRLEAAARRVKMQGQGSFESYINELAELDKMLKANLITWQEYENAVTQAQEKHFKVGERTKKVLEETRTAQDEYNDKMKELNELRGVKGGLSEEQYRQAVERTNAELRKAQMEGSLFGDIMDKAIDGNIKSWKDLGSAVVEFGKTMLKNLINGQGLDGKGGGLADLLGGAGSMLGSLFGGGSKGSKGGGGASWLGQLGSFAMSFFHGGGVVGSAGGMSRRVNPGVFAGAPRFHSGGLVGGEVPIIAKKGERVLTEQQQREGLGNTVVYNIDARGAAAGVEQELRQMIMQLNNSIEPRSVKAVQSARARDPQLFNGRT